MVLLMELMPVEQTLQPVPQESIGMSGNAVEVSPFCAILFVDS